MWWIFKSAVVRKIAYVLVALAASFIFGHRAHATTFVFPATGGTPASGGPTPIEGSGSAYCADATARVQSTGGASGGYTLTGISGAPTAAGQTVFCSLIPSGGLTSPASVAGTMSCSATAPNLDLLTALGGGIGYTSGGGYCVAGCEYTNGNLAVNFGAPPGTVTYSSRLAGKAVATGVACGVTGTVTTSQAPSQNQACSIKAGVSTCVDSTDNLVTIQNAPGGTFSVVSPNVPSTPQTCVSYADGGAACNSGTVGMSTPPGPSTVSSTSSPATPTAQVSSSTSGNIVNYYNPTTVAASKGPVNTAVGAGGNPLGTTTASGTGITGTGPSAANGDCAASAVNCTGDGTLPSLTRSDTIQSNVQDYWNAVQAAPIVAAFSSITGSWPTASCPTVPFTLTVFHGSHDYDAFAPVCTIWGGTVAPTLSLVFLGLWAVAGIRVILSA
jgi:hypothetical protein